MEKSMSIMESFHLEGIEKLEDESCALVDHSIDSDEIDELTKVHDQYLRTLEETHELYLQKLEKSELQKKLQEEELDRELEKLHEKKEKLKETIVEAENELAEETAKLKAAEQKLSQIRLQNEIVAGEISKTKSKLDTEVEKINKGKDLEKQVKAYQKITGVTWEPMPADGNLTKPVRGYAVTKNNKKPELQILEWNPEDPDSSTKLWNALLK